MRKLILALALVSGAAFAEETERPVLVISTAAGTSTAGGEIGVYNDAGRLRYGADELLGQRHDDQCASGGSPDGGAAPYAGVL